MSDEENILKLKEEVEKAVNLIKAKHKGANLKEAFKYLDGAGESLKKDKLEDALELSIKAQLSARPDTEYLLSKGRELAGSAEKSFQSKNYENAVELWNKAIEEYDRAVALSKERKEQEILDSVSAIKNRLKENISKTEIAIDNQKMLDLVAVGSRDAEKANKLFEAKNFDEAKDVYNEAGELYRKALEFAENRNFTDDEAKIEGALKSIETSVEASLLSKGDAMLREAEADLKKRKFVEAEECYSSVIKYLKGLNVSGKKDLESMIVSGKVGLIKAKLEQGKEKMVGAEKLIKSNKNYEAKEAYKASRNFFEGVRDEATGYTNLVDELNNFVDACTQNIKEASKAFVNVEDVGGVELEIVNVNEVGKGSGEFKRDTRRYAAESGPIFSFPSELLDEYSKAIYHNEGATSWVYKALRSSDGLTVAVKIPKQFDKKTGKIFLDEIANWRNFNHKNIAKIFDYNAYPRPHIEMEFLESSLENFPKPMEIKKASYLIFKIADGIKYAHKKHILHNDLKPSNILFANDEEPKIADWGLSRVMKSSIFSEGLAKGGTTLYMAPEQILNEKVDERTDVWQLGAIFYEMVTGKTPFEAENEIALSKKILEQEPIPIKNDKQIGKALNEIILKCLKKDKEKRYQSMEDLQYDLARILDIELNTTMKISKDRLVKIKLCTDLMEIYAPLSDKKKCMMYLNELRLFVKNPETAKKIESITELHELDFGDDLIRQRIDEVIHLARIRA